MEKYSLNNGLRPQNPGYLFLIRILYSFPLKVIFLVIFIPFSFYLVLVFVKEEPCNIIVNKNFLGVE